MFIHPETKYYNIRLWYNRSRIVVDTVVCQPSRTKSTWEENHSTGHVHVSSFILKTQRSLVFQITFPSSCVSPVFGCLTCPWLFSPVSRCPSVSLGPAQFILSRRGSVDIEPKCRFLQKRLVQNKAKLNWKCPVSGNFKQKTTWNYKKMKLQDTCDKGKKWV